jgi:hypothetical protein
MALYERFVSAAGFKGLEKRFLGAVSDIEHTWDLPDYCPFGQLLTFGTANIRTLRGSS